MRPPATTGCVPPELAPGSPNAHANFRRGTSRAVIPAASPDWNRVFVIPAPQPFQLGPVSEARNGPAVLLQNADLGMIAGSLASGLPDRYSARTRRCARLRSAACAFIAPFSNAWRICSALIRLKMSRLGACELPPASWQVAQ